MLFVTAFRAPYSTGRINKKNISKRDLKQISMVTKIQYLISTRISSIAGGNSVQPKKGFYKNQPVDELDIKGMYPTIAIAHNISFETVNFFFFCVVVLSSSMEESFSRW